MITRRLLAITAGTLLAAPASEVFDVRINVGVAPPTEQPQITYRDSGGGSAAEDPSGLDAGLRLQVGMVKSVYDLSPQGQCLLSLHGIYGQQSGSEVNAGVRPYDSLGPIKLGVLAVQFGLGYAHWFGDSTHLEILPFIGFGSAGISDTGPGETTGSKTTDEGHGQYHEYGFSMGLYRVVGASKIVAGIGFSYYRAHSEADLEFNLVGGGKLYEHVEIDQVGVSPWVVIGMRF